MPATVVDAVKSPFPCPCRCHDVLSVDERVAGIEALYRFDDAMRGSGHTVIWDPPQEPGRNDLCVCGSMRKWKQCCGAQV